jgi:hypothetical protein
MDTLDPGGVEEMLFPAVTGMENFDEDENPLTPPGMQARGMALLSNYVVPDRKVLNFLAGNALDPVWVGEVWREVVEFVRPNH